MNILIGILVGVFALLLLIWIIGCWLGASGLPQRLLDKAADRWHRTHPKRWPHWRKEE